MSEIIPITDNTPNIPKISLNFPLRVSLVVGTKELVAELNFSVLLVTGTSITNAPLPYYEYQCLHRL